MSNFFQHFLLNKGTFYQIHMIFHHLTPSYCRSWLSFLSSVSLKLLQVFMKFYIFVIILCNVMQRCVFSSHIFIAFLIRSSQRAFISWFHEAKLKCYLEVKREQLQTIQVKITWHPHTSTMSSFSECIWGRFMRVIQVVWKDYSRWKDPR